MWRSTPSHPSQECDLYDQTVQDLEDLSNLYASYLTGTINLQQTIDNHELMEGNNEMQNNGVIHWPVPDSYENLPIRVPTPNNFTSIPWDRNCDADQYWNSMDLPQSTDSALAQRRTIQQDEYPSHARDLCGAHVSGSLPQLNSSGLSHDLTHKPHKGSGRIATWMNVVPSALHSKSAFAGGHASSAPLFSYEDGKIAGDSTSFIALVRMHGTNLHGWSKEHLIVSQNGKELSKLERRRARELHCGNAMTDWYLQQVGAMANLSEENIALWSKKTIEEIFAVEGNPALAKLFSWNNLEAFLTRSGREEPAVYVRDWTVSFVEEGPAGPKTR